MNAEHRNRRLFDLSLELSEICHAVETDLLRQKKRRTIKPGLDEIGELEKNPVESDSVNILEPPIL